MADTGAKYEGGRAGGRVSRPGGCKGGTLNLKFSNFPFFPSLWSLAAYPLPPSPSCDLIGRFLAFISSSRGFGDRERGKRENEGKKR